MFQPFYLPNHVTRLQETVTTAQQIQTWNINNQKDLQKKRRLGTVSYKWLEGLNIFNGIYNRSAALERSATNDWRA